MSVEIFCDHVEIGVMELNVRVLGELEVHRGNIKLNLPASKRTRVLLGYLVLTNRPQRREKLCDLLWQVPDDPRGALRWSLSKLRRVVNDEHTQRLIADRERVTFIATDCNVDLFQISKLLEDNNVTLETLEDAYLKLSEELLSGADFHDLQDFQMWLTSEREELTKTRTLALSLLAQHPDTLPDKSLEYSRLWHELAPFDRHAANCLLAANRRLGLHDDIEKLATELTEHFHNAGIDWKPSLENVSEHTGVIRTPREQDRHYLLQQDIRFCKSKDNVTLAYASVGNGPPLIKAANWLTHLELDWDAPIWSPLFRELARDHQFIRYDERGNGLSDWDVPEISFEKFVTDLETVIDDLGLSRFPLLGISQGAAVCIAYAVRHPERVSHLILFGGYPTGWRINTSEELRAEREAILTLTKTGWGQDNPAYRHIFSATFMPDASAEQLTWFDNFQRQTTSSENAVRFLSAFGDIDVRAQLPKVSVPTLVLHSRGDKRIPWETGREIATQIPGAAFKTLESNNHLLLSDERASLTFVETIREFLA